MICGNLTHNPAGKGVKRIFSVIALPRGGKGLPHCWAGVTNQDQGEGLPAIGKEGDLIIRLGMETAAQKEALCANDGFDLFKLRHGLLASVLTHLFSSRV